MAQQLPIGMLNLLRENNLEGGDADAVGVTIHDVVLSNGATINLSSPGVTAVVGPNNSGKSTLLRELHQAISEEPGSAPPRRLVTSAKPTLTGSTRDVAAWLSRHAGYSDVQGLEGFSPIGPGNVLQASYLPNMLNTYWSSLKILGTNLTPFFVFYADTESRLSLSTPAPVRENARSAPTHAIHVLTEDTAKRQSLDNISRNVFEQPMQIDSYSAANRLRFGTVGVAAPIVGTPEEDSYRDSLLRLPELSEQGDGMRSFFGLLIPLFARTFSIVIVDEPESFLHPPQASALGRALGELSIAQKVQIVVATHDRNLLSGLLESDTTLTVVRLDRIEQRNLAKQVSADELRTIWDQPELKYSNALDGLFHKLVVLVEGDRDARFMAATLDSLNSSDADPQTSLLSAPGEGAQAQFEPVHIAPSDVLFIPTFGKGGMARLARMLHGLGVPVVASPDFDMVRTKAELRLLFEALGGNWDAVDSDYTMAVSRISNSSSPLKVSDLIATLGTDPDEMVTPEVEERVRRFLKTAHGGWAQVKSAGLSALGSGGVGAAASRLLDKLAKHGLVPLRIGELESFAPELEVAKGRGWVPAALEAKVHESPAALDHLRRILAARVQEAILLENQDKPALTG